jgi:uncharacterized protein YqgC (DUF456 family)
MPEILEQILVHSGLILLYLVSLACLVLTFLGLGGNWVLCAIALVVKLTGIGEMTWWWFVACVALAGLGELVEALLGAVVVARRGGTRWGIAGTIVGGIAGAILGSPVAPPIGTLVFGFVGAFLGAAGGEYLRDRRMDHAVRIGFWSFVGRSMATLGKVVLGFVIVWIIVVATW